MATRQCDYSEEMGIFVILRDCNILGLLVLRPQISSVQSCLYQWAALLSAVSAVDIRLKGANRGNVLFQKQLTYNGPADSSVTTQKHRANL